MKMNHRFETISYSIHSLLSIAFGVPIQHRIQWIIGWWYSNRDVIDVSNNLFLIIFETIEHSLPFIIDLCVILLGLKSFLFCNKKAIIILFDFFQSDLILVWWFQTMKWLFYEMQCINIVFFIIVWHVFCHFYFVLFVFMEIIYFFETDNTYFVLIFFVVLYYCIRNQRTNGF